MCLCRFSLGPCSAQDARLIWAILSCNPTPPVLLFHSQLFCSSNRPLFFSKNVLCPSKPRAEARLPPSSAPPGSESAFRALSWRFDVHAQGSLPGLDSRLKGQSGPAQLRGGHGARPQLHPQQMGFSLGVHARPPPPSSPPCWRERCDFSADNYSLSCLEPGIKRDPHIQILGALSLAGLEAGTGRMAQLSLKQPGLASRQDRGYRCLAGTAMQSGWHSCP